MAVKLGLGLPQMKQYDIGRDIPDVARAAEETGYESLWVFERILFPTPATQGLYGIEGLPWPDLYRSVAEPFVCMTLAAAATRRATIGSSVLVAPLHQPFELARSFATLDAVSGGRMVAGLGTGWSHDEYAAQSPAPFAERGKVLDEVIDVCRAVWGPDPVSYEGALTTIAPSEVGPKPAHEIPVYLPALSPRSARRLVDRAEGWMPAATGPRQLADAWRRLRELAAERGRERPLAAAVRVNTQYSKKPYDGQDRRPFQGDVGQIVEDLAAHVEASGLEEFFLELQGGTRDAEELKDVAAEVYTAARAAGI
ncbi:TIGR03619 family F420-dependent LLM class oxidoreductase [Streptomyces monticola]|uniref:TIGR03619 family F420-dependent LLM class oxidoreductase n=1 Tax=Streptomyces monticola TaxID=2666263 RepID=A0ABW2JNB6_9ACTN